jgi:hypothetical protein
MLNSVLQRSDKIIQYLMEQFSNKEMSSFVGNTLRILIKSEVIGMLFLSLFYLLYLINNK